MTCASANYRLGPQAGADAAGVDVSQVDVTFVFGCDIQGRRKLQAADDFVTVQYDFTAPDLCGTLPSHSPVSGCVYAASPLVYIPSAAMSLR